MAATRAEEVVVPDRRVWTRRPDRRWGWVSHDGYELEWRVPESGQPRGYYLFGHGLTGIWCGTEAKALVQEWADSTIADFMAGRVHGSCGWPARPAPS